MDYFFSVRGRRGDGYSDKLGGVKYLAVPPQARAIGKPQEISRTEWFAAVQEEAKPDTGPQADEKGHVVFFVHGFNTDQWDMLERHRKIKAGLGEAGYKGSVVSFDWPSDANVLGYNADRRDARLSADRLFKYGIARFSAMQVPDCPVNVHVLAHSMGCFLLREAFDFADDDHDTAQNAWTMSQIALVAADISAKSMRLDNPKTSSLLRHCTRLTNYYSPLDEVLSISEVKRIGVSRRLGRTGMPSEYSEKAVDLYCGGYFKAHRGDFPAGKAASHRWYFDTPQFYEDLCHTFTGNLDRAEIPTRGLTDRDTLALRTRSGDVVDPGAAPGVTPHNPPDR